MSEHRTDQKAVSIATWLAIVALFLLTLLGYRLIIVSDHILSGLDRQITRKPRQ